MEIGLIVFSIVCVDIWDVNPKTISKSSAPRAIMQPLGVNILTEIVLNGCFEPL